MIIIIVSWVKQHFKYFPKYISKIWSITYYWSNGTFKTYLGGSNVFLKCQVVQSICKRHISNTACVSSTVQCDIESLYSVFVGNTGFWHHLYHHKSWSHFKRLVMANFTLGSTIYVNSLDKRKKKCGSISNFDHSYHTFVHFFWIWPYTSFPAWKYSIKSIIIPKWIKVFAKSNKVDTAFYSQENGYIGNIEVRESLN